MAADWVAPLAAGTAGSMGAFFTWLAGKQGRDHAAHLADVTHQHSRQLARDARLAEAYVEILDIAEHLGNWAQSVRPMINTGSAPPGFPPIDKQLRAEALTRAFGSPKVFAALELWRKAVSEIGRADIVIGLSVDREARTGLVSSIDHGEIWQRLESEMRPAERRLRDELASVINAELAGERPGGESAESPQHVRKPPTATNAVNG